MIESPQPKEDKGQDGWAWARWAIAGGAILGAIAYIAFGNDRGTGMLLGILAILLARTLLRVNPR